MHAWYRRADRRRDGFRAARKGAGATLFGLLGWVLVAGAVPVFGTQVSVRLHFEGAVPASLRVQVEARPVGGAEEAQALPEGLSKEVEPGEASAFDLQDDLLWKVVAKAPGFWSPPELVRPADQEGSILLSLFPTRKVEAKVEPDRFGQRPDRFEVRFQPAPDAGRSASRLNGRVECLVEKGSFRCGLPIGRLDLRISAPPWSPSYRLGVEVAASSSTTLDPISLVRGASVSGWVVLENGDPAPSGTSVELSVGGAEGAETEARLGLMEQHVRTRDRGFFQFLGVKPGLYRLVARAKGFAPARVAPIEAQPDLESFLKEPVRLARPVLFRVELDPPLDPWGHPWTVRLGQLQRGSGKSLNSLEEAASREGKFEHGGLAPGSYRLTLLGSNETQWFEQEIEVGRDSEPLLLPIPLIAVTGSIEKGDEAVSGRLWFGTRQGTRRIVIDADEEGRFEGYLPSPGQWPVEWTPSAEDDEAEAVSLEPIEVPDRRHVSLELEIPDTEIAGKVVDTRDRPVAGASIRLFGGGPERPQGRSKTDEEGEFLVIGLEPGQYGVEASHGTRTSETVHLTVSKGLDPPDLRLVLRDKLTISGRVLSAGVGVPGARVTAWSDLGTSAGVAFLQAITGPEGTFELQASGEPRGFSFMVSAPNRGVHVERIEVSGDDLVELALDPYPGTLEIDGLAGAKGTPFLVHGGSFLPVLGFARLASLDRQPPTTGGELVLPGLEPGRYALCSGPGVLDALRLGADAAEGCSTGVLPPLGGLRLTVPRDSGAESP